MSTSLKPEDIVLDIARANGGQNRFLVIVRYGERTLARDTLSLNSQFARRRVIRAALDALLPPGTSGEDAEAFFGDLECRLLAAAAAPSGSHEPPAGTLGPVVDDPRPAALEEMSVDVRAEAERLLESPDLLRRVHEHIRAMGVVGESCLGLLLYLVGVSAQLSKPLAGIVRGLTASGKSFVVTRVTLLFPPEVVLHATSLTTNALYYFPPGRLRHLFIVAGERSRLETDDRAEATRALREMIESGRLTKAVPVKEDDQIVTRVITQEGPIAYLETTTLTDIFAEDANRCLLLSTDESDVQTRRVLNATALAAAGHTPADISRVIAVHHALQRMLPRADVIIPFAPAIAKLFDVGEDVRRRFPQVLRLVKASAVLHFRQRGRDAEGRIVADRRDYQVAARLLTGPMAAARGEVGTAAREFFKILEHRYPAEEFNAPALVTAGYGSRSAVYQRLTELDGKGLIEQTEAPRGRVPARWRLTGQRPRPDTGGLPTVEEVETWLAAQTAAG